MYIKRQGEAFLEKTLKSPKVGIILGARQVGKTTLVKHVIGNRKVLFLNLDIDVDKQRLIAVSSLPPADAVKALGHPDIIIIDEAQRLLDVGRIVKGWYDSGVSSKVILLGSSSLDILNQSAESLTGRNEKMFLPPLLFPEIVSAQSWFLNNISKEKILNDFEKQINELLMQSLVFGSYPEVVTTAEKQIFLLNLASDYLMKDVLNLGLVKNPDTVKRLLMLLAHQVGSEVSINELSIGMGVSRVTVERYIDLLERTYVIFKLPAFSTNPRKEINKSKKIYFWDTGVRNALLNDFSLSPLRPDIGSLWENWVVAEFAKKNALAGGLENLYFWRSRDGSEVDLIVKNGNVMRAYEIKWQKQSVNKRQFSSWYKIPVKVIDRTQPFI